MKYLSLVLVSIASILTLTIDHFVEKPIIVKRLRWILLFATIVGILFSFFILNDSLTSNEKLKTELDSINRNISKNAILFTKSFNNKTDTLINISNLNMDSMIRYLANTEIDQVKKEQDRYSSFTPKIVVECQELNNNKVYIFIHYPLKNKSKINKLFIKFDLPGTYVRFKKLNIDKIEKYRIDTFFICGNKHTGNYAETFQLNIDNLYPGGSISGHVYFQSHQLITQNIDIFHSYHYKLYDLHDYLTYSYNWIYDGIDRTEFGYLDISNFNYIKIDNKCLKETVSYTKWAVSDQLNKYPKNSLSIFLIENMNNLRQYDTIKIPQIDLENINSYYLLVGDTITNVTKIYKDYMDDNYIKELGSSKTIW